MVCDNFHAAQLSYSFLLLIFILSVLRRLDDRKGILSLCLSPWTWVRQYQNVYILDLVEP